jgi:hypothetical protein
MTTQGAAALLPLHDFPTTRRVLDVRVGRSLLRNGGDDQMPMKKKKAAKKKKK